MTIVKVGEIKIKIRPNTTDIKVVEEVIKKKTYFKKGVSLTSDDIVLDLGGNIGTFACLAGSMGAKVYTYEPDKENFKLLKENIALNNLQSKVKAFNKAVVWDKGSGKAYIYKVNNEYQKYTHSLMETKGRKKEVISTVSMDSVNTKRGITFLKADIEGSERQLLDNISWNKPGYKSIRNFAFEYDFAYDKKIKNFKRRMQKLRQYGWKVEHRRGKVLEGDEWKYFPTGLMIYCSR